MGIDRTALEGGNDPSVHTTTREMLEHTDASTCPTCGCVEKAKKIAALQADNARMRGVLDKIQSGTLGLPDSVMEEGPAATWSWMWVESQKAARAALSTKPAGESVTPAPAEDKAAQNLAKHKDTLRRGDIASRLVSEWLEEYVREDDVHKDILLHLEGDAARCALCELEVRIMGLLREDAPAGAFVGLEKLREAIDPERLAAIIRRVDGNHNLAAGELAEALAAGIVAAIRDAEKEKT
jgi:hypothetical protein